MPAYAVVSPDIFIGPFDVSGDVSSITGNIMTNDIDVTTFGSNGWHVRIAGLHDVDLSLDGYTNLGGGNVEESLYGIFGVTNQVVTISETTGAQGEPALMFKALEVGYDQPTKVGDAAQFKVPLKGSSAAARGVVLWPKTSVASSSSSGTGINLGAVGATQYLYATQHLTSFVGSATASLVTTIKSATNSSMLGATTRLTFTTATTASAEFAARVAGPITDTFWQASWTVTGNTVSIPFVVAAGIQ